MAQAFVRIDRLVLRGISATQREAVVDALRAELGRAFAQPDVVARWAASGHRERVSGRMTRHAEGADLGAEAARRIAKA